MFRTPLTTSAAVLFSALPALADQGAHHHPHGIEYGWIVAAAVGAIVGAIFARLRGR